MGSTDSGATFNCRSTNPSTDTGCTECDARFNCRSTNPSTDIGSNDSGATFNCRSTNPITDTGCTECGTRFNCRSTISDVLKVVQDLTVGPKTPVQAQDILDRDAEFNGRSIVAGVRDNTVCPHFQVIDSMSRMALYYLTISLDEECLSQLVLLNRLKNRNHPNTRRKLKENFISFYEETGMDFSLGLEIHEH
ncbi:hypothetical protein PoB_000166600 [Plakobranchus ocellatus]|uniref:Uncharacterized protein n=1 Tax=Plakobranchus ocellatus TaxID=259542 RepID=A0AAV3XYK2_9GAST|nr:hypothetical protein PoB_000166600 [Plakobranchus ocellatus]